MENNSQQSSTDTKVDSFSKTDPAVNQSQQAIQPSAPKQYKKPLIAVGILLGFVLFGIGGYTIGLQRSSQINKINTAVLPTQSPTTTAQREPGKVAYRMNGTVLEGGDVWVSNPDSSGKRKLTSSGHIGWLYSWSPDNRFILASTNEVSQNFTKTTYVVVDSQSGKETIIPVVRGASGDGNSDFVWTGNNEITYIDENVVYKITTDGQKSEVNRVPSSTQAIFYHLNKSANKIAFDTSAPGFSGDMINVFVYDFASQQKIQISEGGNAYILGWTGNSVVYQQGKSLWSSSADGKNKNKLTDLGEWYILGSALSQDGSKIFFTADNRGSGKPNEGKVFVYDSTTNKLIEVGSLDNNTFASNLSMSRDANIGAYTLSGIVNAPSVTVTFANDKSVNLCESSCYYPVWQN